jgi:hypothetical protein
MIDLTARLKQATETLSLEWCLTDGSHDNRIMRCNKTSHCVGSAILTTVKPQALAQYFLHLEPSDYGLLGVTEDDAITVVGAGDNWSNDRCENYARMYKRPTEGFEAIPTLRGMFLEAVGLKEGETQ